MCWSGLAKSFCFVSNYILWDHDVIIQSILVKCLHLFLLAADGVKATAALTRQNCQVELFQIRILLWVALPVLQKKPRRDRCPTKIKKKNKQGTSRFFQTDPVDSYIVNDFLLRFRSCFNSCPGEKFRNFIPFDVRTFRWDPFDVRTFRWDRCVTDSLGCGNICANCNRTLKHMR